MQVNKYFFNPIYYSYLQRILTHCFDDTRYIDLLLDLSARSGKVDLNSLVYVKENMYATGR